MNFAYSGEYETHSAIIDSNFFTDLILLIKKSPQSPILRELKQAFPIKNFERKLEELIELKLINRYERRYTLGFPVFSLADQERILIEHADFLTSYRKMDAVMQAELLAAFCIIPESAYFYGYENSVQLTSIDNVQNQDLQLISFTEGSHQKSIGRFFHANQKLEQLDIFSHLNQLIGDVDAEYYLDQVSVILERIRKGRKVRRNIFLESLFDFGILTNQEKPEIIIPLIRRGELDRDIPRKLKAVTGFEKRCILTQMIRQAFSDNRTLLIEK